MNDTIPWCFFPTSVTNNGITVHDILVPYLLILEISFIYCNMFLEIIIFYLCINIFIFFINVSTLLLLRFIFGIFTFIIRGQIIADMAIEQLLSITKNYYHYKIIIGFSVLAQNLNIGTSLIDCFENTPCYWSIKLVFPPLKLVPLVEAT